MPRWCRALMMSYISTGSVHSKCIGGRGGGKTKRKNKKTKTNKNEQSSRNCRHHFSTFTHNGHSPHEVFTRDVNNTAGTAAEPHLQLPFVTAKTARSQDNNPITSLIHNDRHWYWGRLTDLPSSCNRADRGVSRESLPVCALKMCKL